MLRKGNTLTDNKRDSQVYLRRIPTQIIGLDQLERIPGVESGLRINKFDCLDFPDSILIKINFEELFSDKTIIIGLAILNQTAYKAELYIYEEFATLYLTENVEKR